MTTYPCLKCDKVFTRKDNLETHITNNACKEYTHYCKFCNRGFTCETSMYRHVRTVCKEKKKNDEEKDEIYEKLKKMEEQMKNMAKEYKAIKKENKELSRRIENVERPAAVVGDNNNVNINNGTVNNTNNIILVGYGKEDLSKIDKKEILKAMQSGYDSPLKLTETLHFNPKHPEYQNIYITNVKDKYAMMFDGKDWNLTMKDDLINRIYDDKKNYIEENIDEFVDSLTSSRKQALDRWLDTSDDDERILKIKNDIRLLLYNKRNLVLADGNEIKKLKQPVKRKTKKQVQKDGSDSE
jgi:hypothetical protein